MKKIFTKTIYVVLTVILFMALAHSASAQYTSKTLLTNTRATAVAKDASGNVYVVDNPSNSATGEILKYTNGTGSPTVIFNGSQLMDIDVDGDQDDYVFGLAVASNGDIYFTTDNDFATPFYGNIVKLTFNGGTSYTPTIYRAGNATVGAFASIAIDSSDNLFVVQYDVNGNGGSSANLNNIPGSYEVAQYSLSNSSTFTRLYDKLELTAFNSPDQSSAITGLAVDPSGNIFVADNFDVNNLASNGGVIYKLTKSTGYTASTVATGQFARALSTDASGNLYATIGNTLPAYQLVKYTGGTGSPTTLYTPLGTDGVYYPTGLAVINNNNIFVTNGENGSSGGIGNLLQVFGTPTTQATNVNFTNITGTTATANWTNGDGSSRAVFIKQTSTVSSPVPVNSTTYTAATAAYTTGTQIGGTGWYCIYNGTGTTANISGLTAGQTYQVMAVEYNGASGSENYFITPGTNNPNTLITIPPTTINSIALVGSSPTNAASVSYTATFGAAITGLTTSNFVLAGAGATGASITSVTPVSTSVYTIAVSTGNDGSLGLNLQNFTNLSPSISTTLPFTGSVYTIDKTSPLVSSVGVPANGSYTVGNNLNFTVNFSEAVIVNTTGGTPYILVTLNTGGTVHASYLSGSGTGVLTFRYTVASGDADPDGVALGSAITLNGGTLTDAATNTAALTLNSVGSTTGVLVDTTPPTVSSITAVGTSPNNATSDQYTVVFSENVSNVTAAAFTITTVNNPALTTSGISSISGSGTTYTVTIGGVAGDGTMRLDANSSGTGITDAAGNGLSGGFTTGSVYTIDQTPPAAIPASEIFVSNNSNVRAAKVGNVITLSFTTTEPIQTPVITIDGHSVTPSNPSGNNWSVNYTMTSSDTEGPVSFDVQAQDLAGNTVDISSAALPPQFVITFDKTAPTITIGAPSVASINSGTGDVTYTVTYADANLNAITLAPGDITLNTTGDATGTVSVVNSSSNSTVTISGITGSGTIGISIAAGTAADVAGNLAPASGASTTFAVVLNTENITFNALPTKTYGDADFAPGATSDNNGPAITYSSDNTAVATIVAGNIHIVGAGSANITASQAGDATHSAAIDQIQPLTVNAAPLTITADNQTKAYGDAIPTLTASYSGFVNGDDASSLTTTPTLTTTATAASHVAGSPYAITASGAVDPNYTISYVPGSLTISAAPLTITADNQTKAYGDAIPTLTASYAGLVNGDTGASLTTPPTLTTTATAASTVAGSPYAITASGAVDADYSISYVPGSLTITTAPLTIIADNQTKAYGDAIPTLTASYTGFVNGDDASSLTTAPTLTTTATAASHVAGSPYAIIASGAVDPDYTISYALGSLTITAAPLTITADNQTKVYGDAIPTLTASYAGFVNGDTGANLTTPPTLTTTATAASTVAGNPYAITASGAVDADYSISYIDGNLTVTAAPLTATADNQSSTYGQALPALTVSYAGFVNGDTQASLTTTATASTPATAASPAGSYTITPSGAVDNNYQITYTNGTLTIGQAALTATADNQSSTYGQALPALTVSYAGFVNGDTQASLTTPATASTPATAASPAGSYTITPSGAVDNNYQITYTNGTLTIGQAALTATADNQSSTYGQALPALTVSYAGFVNGDTQASLTTAATASTPATAASPAGSYTITPSGAVDNNYQITYTNGTLTIGQAALTATADNQSSTYGQALPALTVSYAGFVNGDTQASLTTAATASTPATAASPAGSYTITPSGAVDNNYQITYTNGTLTIGQAALTATADNQNSTYGQALPALTVSYAGFVNGDTQASLTTTATASTPATAASPAGSYTITPSGAVDNNYQITYTNGTLTIGQTALTVMADNQTKAYGDAIPTLTASYSGFVNGDNAASLATAPMIATTATMGSSVTGSPYPITASGAVDPNYIISYVPGNLTIGAVPLTITANNQTKIAGTANPPLTVNYTGFVNGDSNTNLTTQPIVSTTAITGSPAGPYPITANGAADANYTISYVAGTLTIAPVGTTGSVIAFAPIPQQTYGNTDFAPGATSNNNVTPVTYTSDNTAVATIVSGKVHIVGAGTANITAMQAAGGTFTAAANVIEQLKVVPSALIITANNQTKIAGTANPPLTVSYTGFVNGDANTNLATQPVVTTTATTGSPAGPYTITASGAVDANYTISYVAGTLTINPVGSTSSVIAFAPIAQQTYGNTDFAPGATSNNNVTPVTYNSDNTAVATIVSGKVHIVGPGTANITAMQAAGGTFTAAANVIEQLKVVPEAITVTANAQSKTSGQPDPALTYAVTTGALVGTDTFTGALIRVAGENPGTYAIKQGTLALSNNYTLTYISANLVIGQKVLTITAANQTKVYGVANPALTVSYSGFVNGDTQASLTTKPTISTVAVTGSGAGTYPVTASGAAIAGYTIVYVPGTLTVTRAVLTVTADNQTRNYGEANPALSVAYSGFVNGDDIASLTSPAVAATTAAATTAPGSYPITADGAVSANYSFNYVAGTLVIKPLTNANLANLTLSSGILTPGFDTGTLTYTSFVENSADQITLTPTLSDPTATVRVNGTLTGSGTSSADIPLSVGSNVITVEVTAQDGVTKLDYTVTVTRDESILAITATNILTPNGDGKNDTWVIQDIQHYPNNSVIVYDRAGRVVYNKNGYTNDWGGTLGGVPLNEGTYYYVVNLGPGLRTFKGYISILRSN